MRHRNIAHLIRTPPKFDPHRFSLYAKDLSQAVLELSREKMGATSDLRNYLGNENVKVRFGDGKKFITMDDKTTEFNADASNELVAKTLNLQKIDDLAGQQTVAAAPVAAPRPTEPIADLATSNITGLQSGAFQAKLAEMRQKIVGKQNQALAKIDSAVASGAAKMDAAAENVAGKVDKEIAAALQEFAQYSNGGPA